MNQDEYVEYLAQQNDRKVYEKTVEGIEATSSEIEDDNEELAKQRRIPSSEWQIHDLSIPLVRPLMSLSRYPGKRSLNICR